MNTDVVAVALFVLLGVVVLLSLRVANMVSVGQLAPILKAFYDGGLALASVTKTQADDNLLARLAPIFEGVEAVDFAGEAERLQAELEARDAVIAELKRQIEALTPPHYPA